jgi:hypothetical protein
VAVLVNYTAKSNPKGSESKAVTFGAVIQLVMMMPVEGLGNA